jgi:tRNA pseudouridine38-40 synthase
MHPLNAFENSYRLLISYEGTNYKGWQKNQALNTVELAIEKALTKLRLPFSKLEAASRTDSGVHALGQVIRLDLVTPFANSYQLRMAINSQLPEDIRLLEIFLCEPNFHPSLQAKSKTYHYFICMSPVQIPIHRLFSWHVPYTLNLKQMSLAATYLEGEHNFRAFTSSRNHEPYNNYTREIQKIEFLILESSRLKIIVRGNHFLYKMVRNLVGTLVDVGRSKIDPESIHAILLSEDRRQAGITAPAHGLFLNCVEY